MVLIQELGKIWEYKKNWNSRHNDFAKKEKQCKVMVSMYWLWKRSIMKESILHFLNETQIKTPFKSLSSSFLCQATSLACLGLDLLVLDWCFVFWSSMVNCKLSQIMHKDDWQQYYKHYFCIEKSKPFFSTFKVNS